MALPVWLTVSAAVVGLIGGTSGFVSSLYHAFVVRQAWDDALRRDIGRPWTNEGSLGTTEDDLPFITVALKLEDGDVYGEISTSAYKRPLGVHLKIGWFASTLIVTELVGSSALPVADVRIRLRGNRNRLSWKVVSGNKLAWLPQKALLWPSRIKPSDPSVLSTCQSAVEWNGPTKPGP